MYKYDEVKNFIEIESESGCKLISKKYENCKEDLEILCGCGKNIFVTRFDHFKNSNIRQCNDCRNSKRAKKYNEKVKKIIKDFSYEVLNDICSCEDDLIIKDKYGYIYKTTLSLIISKHAPHKFYTTNPYTIQNIRLWLKLNNKPFELISDIYTGDHDLLQWKCLKKYCSRVFEKDLHSICGKGNCTFCVRANFAYKRSDVINCLANINQELAQSWHPTKNGNMTPNNTTLGSGIRIWWQCKFGHEWKTTINKRIKGYECLYCSGKRPSETNNLLITNHELSEEWDYSKNEKRPEDYTKNSTKIIWWICKKCGHEWKASIIKRNEGGGCIKHKESKGEKRVRKYLKDNNIYYDFQYKFEDLKSFKNFHLKFDFAIFEDKQKTKLSKIIEYDGLFHYEVARFSKDKDKMLRKFEEQQYRDELKNKYCVSNNINLLRIPYWDYDNIETILSMAMN